MRGTETGTDKTAFRQAQTQTHVTDKFYTDQRQKTGRETENSNVGSLLIKPLQGQGPWFPSFMKH